MDNKCDRTDGRPGRGKSTDRPPTHPNHGVRINGGKEREEERERDNNFQHLHHLDERLVANWMNEKII